MAKRRFARPNIFRHKNHIGTTIIRRGTRAVVRQTPTCSNYSSEVEGRLMRRYGGSIQGDKKTVLREIK